MNSEMEIQFVKPPKMRVLRSLRTNHIKHQLYFVVIPPTPLLFPVIQYEGNMRFKIIKKNTVFSFRGGGGVMLVGFTERVYSTFQGPNRMAEHRDQIDD